MSRSTPTTPLVTTIRPALAAERYPFTSALALRAHLHLTCWVAVAITTPDAPVLDSNRPNLELAVLALEDDAVSCRGPAGG